MFRRVYQVIEQLKVYRTVSKFNLQNELLDRARLAKQLEDYLGAEKLVKRAIALTRQEGGPEEHTITRYLTRELAGIHVKAGSLKKAENAWKSHLKSLRQIKKNTETEQLEISKTMVQMALFYQSQDLERKKIGILSSETSPLIYIPFVVYDFESPFMRKL